MPGSTGTQVEKEDYSKGVLRRPKRHHAPIPSPRQTLLPRLTQDQINKLPYPPDVLPGRRDVSTPYGYMRVNEWGPEDGRRVLFVHGDATPSPIWAKIAWRMAQKGCRVMTFDLWGRGYTDSPYPTPHTPDMFKNQVLYAITSSPIAWTGAHQHPSGLSAESGSPSHPPGFSIVGFSLGGSIAVDFTSEFPHLINSIVLLAPGGLLRQLPPDYEAIYSPDEDLSPADPAMRGLVSHILDVRTDFDAEQARRTELAQAEQANAPAAAATASVNGSASVSKDDWTRWTPGIGNGEAEGQKFLADLLQFQFDYHEGHILSFYSTARHGPTHGLLYAWTKVCNLISGKKETTPLGVVPLPSPLHDTKLLLFLGEGDTIIIPDEMEEDVRKLLPEDKLEVITLPGGHAFPWPNTDIITAKLIEWWGLV